jgi:hypothetical protein
MPTVEKTIVDAMLLAARGCTTVAGVDDGRNTAIQPATELLPRINLVLGNSDPQMVLGAGVCTHTTRVQFEIVVRADDVPGTPETAATQPPMRDLADPIRAELHQRLYAAFPFSQQVTSLLPGPTERSEPGDEDGVYREVVSYLVQFETAEFDLSQAP